MKTPCRGCAERTVGCHVECVRYFEYKMRKAVEAIRRRTDGDAISMPKDVLEEKAKMNRRKWRR